MTTLRTNVGVQAPLGKSLPAELDAELDEVWSSCVEQLQVHEELRDAAPLYRLWDGNFSAIGEVHGHLEADIPWLNNEVGTATLVLPAAHPLTRVIVNRFERETENVFLTVDVATQRFGGILDDYSIDIKDDGAHTLTLTFLDELQHLVDYHCWSNPFMPASGPQWPKYFTLGGPSVTVLKLMLLANAIRYNGNLWTLPDNPFDPVSYVELFTTWNWPIVVKPDNPFLDDSEWCIVDARFDSWLTLAQPILEDAELTIVARRWLEGDPPPWPGAVMGHGQLVVDIVDKSGVFEQTSLGGTIFGGLLRTVTEHGDNFVDDIVNTVANPMEPAEYTVSRFFGTKPSQPWIVYHDGEETGIRASQFKHKQTGPVQLTAGGKSAPGVNEAQSLMIQLMGNVIGSIFQLDTLGTIIDTAVKPQYEDVWLAFATWKSPLRTIRAGKFYRHETFIEGADQSYTLSSIVAFRRGMRETAARDFFELDIGSGEPYIIGRHFWVGDRIGATNRYVPGGRVFVEQVHGIRMQETADGVKWSVKCGDLRLDEDPWDRGLRKIRRVTQSMHRHNVI